MARSRPEKTLADYLAIAVTPLLIMLLVGSLIYFLNELVPGRQYNSRIQWILFWFVIGMVLVARIAMESGRAQASLFTLALGAVTAIAIFKFVNDSPWVPIVCLAIIWWCADKLTWDCTLIDDSEDASGEGLLQVAGVADEPELKDGSAPSEEAGTDGVPETQPSALEEEGERVPLWKRVLFNTSEREGKPHAPGLWVVYFSLAALPLFGFGQALIPQSEAATRDFAFRCLLVYVGAGLGLLMLTSFLGLRRYLRQRNLQMPGAMALTWVGMGSAIAVGILVTALLLPRPDSEYDLTAMVDSAAESLQQASDRAFLDDAGGEGESESRGPGHEDAEDGQANDPGQQGQPGGERPGQETAQNAEDGQDGQASGGEESGENQGDGQDSRNTQNQTAQNDGQAGRSQDGNQDDQQSRGDGNQQTANNESGQGNQGDQQQSGEQGDEEREQDDAESQLAQNEADANENASGDSQSSSETPSSPPSSSSFLESLAEMVGTLFKWIVYAIIAAIVLYLAIRHWAAVANFLLSLWHELLALFGRRPEPESEAEAAVEEPAAPAQPFSAFRNPFRSGAAAQHSPSELVRYTFDALQAWAAEHGCGRSDDQTPMEFGQHLKMRRRDDIGSDAHELSQLYARVAYGGVRAKDDSFPLLERLWSRLQQA